MKIFLFLVFIFLSSCNGNNILSLHTEYITIEDLASFYIGTPDPLLNCPPFGQKLTVSWRVPNQSFHLNETSITLTVRFRDHQEITKKILLKRPLGSYVLCLNKEQYCQTGGILTYKAELWVGECLLKAWKHHLWAKLITFEGQDPAEFSNLEGVGLDFELDESDSMEEENLPLN
jgi:hypothetical protein